MAAQKRDSLPSPLCSSMWPCGLDLVNRIARGGVCVLQGVPPLHALSVFPQAVLVMSCLGSHWWGCYPRDSRTRGSGKFGCWRLCSAELSYQLGLTSATGMRSFCLILLGLYPKSKLWIEMNLSLLFPYSPPVPSLPPSQEESCAQEWVL